MADYGGMGGLTERREIDEADAFEMAVARCLGDAMKSDPTLCAEMWSALANMDWVHENGDTAAYTFRAAGDLIAAVIGKGDYLDWYCSGEYAQVSQRVEDALAKEGWQPDY